MVSSAAFLYRQWQLQALAALKPWSGQLVAAVAKAPPYVVSLVVLSDQLVRGLPPPVRPSSIFGWLALWCWCGATRLCPRCSSAASQWAAVTFSRVPGLPMASCHATGPRRMTAHRVPSNMIVTLFTSNQACYITPPIVTDSMPAPAAAGAYHCCAAKEWACNCAAAAAACSDFAVAHREPALRHQDLPARTRPDARAGMHRAQGFLCARLPGQRLLD
jgi:hypothetical protein